jgi:hypothetical protein
MHLQPDALALGRTRHGGAAMVGTSEIGRRNPMPDLSLPEIHLPDVKLPEGLRDINRQDIQANLGDRMPKRIELPDIDLSKVELPKAVVERMPGRKRTNPILPLAAVVAIGSMFAAAWWLITSPTAAIRVRETANRIRARVTGTRLAMERYDDDSHLGSLLPEQDASRPSVAAETWPDTMGDAADTVTAGNGITANRTTGI